MSSSSKKYEVKIVPPEDEENQEQASDKLPKIARHRRIGFTQQALEARRKMMEEEKNEASNADTTPKSPAKK